MSGYSTDEDEFDFDGPSVSAVKDFIAAEAGDLGGYGIDFEEEETGVPSHVPTHDEECGDGYGVDFEEDPLISGDTAIPTITFDGGYGTDDDETPFGVVAGYTPDDIELAPGNNAPPDTKIEDSPIVDEGYLEDSEEAIIEETHDKNTNNKEVTEEPSESDLEDSHSEEAPEEDITLTLRKGEYTELKDWNKEFQTALGLPDSVEKYRALQELGHDFVYAAKNYGKIIISEIHLPENKKTIQSINAGGIAGGEKYICQSIFFKLVTDNLLSSEGEPVYWMYGGPSRNDCAAIKAAGQDLQGLISFYNVADYEAVHFPLMALIDYRGYRLVALSILPVDKTSIIYGSADAGKTCHASDARFNRIMLNLGKQLNLKPHLVCGKQMAACGDIEGHRGNDGKYYMLDFARTFPPEAPPRQTQSGDRVVFFQHLRPEFIRSYRIPLSSDAYTAWGTGDPEAANNNGRVRQATEYLYSTVIPEFAAILDQMVAGNLDQKNWSVTQELHRHGINVRHCGRVRTHCKTDEARKLLLTEMVARVLKEQMNVILRRTMQESRLPLKIPYGSAVVNFANRFIVGNHDDPNDELVRFWTIGVKEFLDKKFLQALTSFESAFMYDLRQDILPSIFFRRFQELTAIEISPTILNELAEVTSLFEIDFSLISGDITSVGAKVKHLNVIDEAEAKRLIYEAKKTFGQRSRQLWSVINRKFEAALSSNTAGYRTLVDWASSLLHQAKQSLDIDESLDTLYSAYEKAQTALRIAPQYGEGLYIAAEIKLEEAVRTAEGSSLKNSLVADVIAAFAKVLATRSSYYQRILDSARLLFQRATSNNFYSFPSQKRIALLSSTILYRTLIAVCRKAQEPVTIFEYCMSMYEYIIAASQDNGYSPHLEASTLATGQALQSYFLRSKKYMLQDKFCKYSITKDGTNFDEQKYRVQIERKDKHTTSPIDIQLPLTHLLGFWVYNYWVKDTVSSDSTFIHEQLHNLLSSAPVPCALLPETIVVVLKYEPIDSFILHRITIDCSQIELDFLPETVKFYSIKHLSDHPKLKEEIQNETLEPLAIFKVREERAAMNHGTVLSASIPKIHGSFIIMVISPCKGEQIMLQNIRFFGTHILKKMKLSRPETQKLGLLVDLSQSQRGERRVRTKENKLHYHMFQKAFENQGYYLSTLIKMATVCPILKVLVQAHLMWASNAPQKRKRTLGGSLRFKANRSSYSVGEEKKNYNAINISHCGVVSDDVIELLCSREIMTLNIAYNSSITDHSIEYMAKTTGESLRVLNAEGCVQLTEKSFEAIIKYCTGLEEFGIWSLAQGDKFTGISKLKRLRKLSLKGCSMLSYKTIRQILSSCGLVVELDLTNCNITDTECKKLASFENLNTLVLDGCRKVTDKGVHHLINCRQLQNLSLAQDEPLIPFILQQKGLLRSLSFSECGSLSNALVTTISHYCSGLKKLDISGIYSIDDTSLVYIAINLSTLEILSVSGTQISDMALSMIGKKMTMLRELYMDDCKSVTNRELTHLYPSQNLESFSIAENHNITQYGIIQFVSKVNTLKQLNVSLCSQISDVTVMKMKHLKPTLELVYHFKSSSQ